MSRVDGGRSAQAQRTEQVAEQNRAGQLPPGMEPGGKVGALGQVVAKGQIPVGPDGKPLTTDGMTAGAQTQAPTVTVANQGLQAGSGTSPFGNLPLGQQVSAEAMRLSEALVGMDLELELPPDVLGKLLGLEKRAAQKGGKFSLNPKLQQAGERMREGTMLMVADASVTAGDGAGDGDVVTVRDTKTIIAGKVVEFGAEAKLANAKQMKNVMFAQRSAFPMGMDVHAFVKAVLREAYMLQNEELLDRGRKMDELNERKKALRKKSQRAEELKYRVLTGNASEEDMKELAFLLGMKVNTQSIEAPEPEEEAADGVDGAGAPGDTPVDGETPTEGDASVGEESPTEEPSSEPANPPGLDEESVAFLTSINETFPSDPKASIGKLEGWLGTGQAMNGFQIVHFGDLSNDPHKITRAMEASSSLPPDKYLQMLRGLLYLQKMKDDNRINKLDSDWNHDRDKDAEAFFSAHQGELTNWIRTLLQNGTATQLAALEGLEGPLRSVLDNAGTGFRHGPLVEQAKIDVGNNLKEPGSHQHRLHDLYQGWTVSSGDGRGFIEELKHELRSGSIEDALTFFSEVGPEMLENGQVSELKELMGSVSSARLNANKDKLEWLDDALAEPLPEDTSAAPDEAPAPSNPEPPAPPPETGGAGGTDTRTGGGGRGGVGTDSGTTTHQFATNDPSSTNTSIPPEPGQTSSSYGYATEEVSLENYEWQHEIEGPITDRPTFEDDVLYINMMTKDEAEALLKNQLDELEAESESIGFDQQMMQMELQDLMQKQQQFLTMMSNMSKMMHDVAMSIIRNIGG